MVGVLSRDLLRMFRYWSEVDVLAGSSILCLRILLGDLVSEVSFGNWIDTSLLGEGGSYFGMMFTASF